MELLVDRIQVGCFVLPEFELGHGSWVGRVAGLQGLLGFEFEDVLNLFGPGNDGSLEDMSFILFRSVRIDELAIGEWEHGPSLVESNHDVDLSHVGIEPLHEILGHEIGPALLVVGVLHNRAQNLIADQIEMVQHVLGHLDKDEVGVDLVGVERCLADSEDDEAWVIGRVTFSFELFGGGRVGVDGDLVCAYQLGVDGLDETLVADEGVHRLSKSHGSYTYIPDCPR